MTQAMLAETASDKQAVLGTISTYLQAIKTAKKPFFDGAFAPTATVSHCRIADESIAVVNMTDFIAEIDDLHKNNDYVEEFHSEPVIAINGPVASALVPFVLKLGTKEVLGTDVFALARIGGEWKITAKLYSA